MATTSQAPQQGITHRPANVPGTTATNSGYASDDEAIPDVDPNDTAAVLEERLQAWKHACGVLEKYISATEHLQRSHAKDYDRVQKSLKDPLREGHHFEQSTGGIAALFENLRTNTQALSQAHLETAKALDGQVMPMLKQLHQEIKGKAKELTKGAAKGAKIVAQARNNTQGHIELLGQHASSSEAVGSKADSTTDPYVINRSTQWKLNRQILEENNNRHELIAAQNDVAAFEAHILQVIQQALSAFEKHMAGLADRQKVMYGDIAGNSQRIAPDFEWNNFVRRFGGVMVDPQAPSRKVESVTYPNMDHASTKALIEGTLERKSKVLGALGGGYKAAHYVVTSSKFLHQYPDAGEDYGSASKNDPSPDLSLYLPDCSVGAVSGEKFNIKGKDASKGKMGNKMMMTTEMQFKAHTPQQAAEWHRIIVQCAGQSTNEAPMSPASAKGEGSVASSPVVGKGEKVEGAGQGL